MIHFDLYSLVEVKMEPLQVLRLEDKALVFHHRRLALLLLLRFFSRWIFESWRQVFE